MNTEIIENIVYDKKVTEDFFVIKDKEKLEKNVNYIKTNFEYYQDYEGYKYGCFHLQFKNHMCLSFCNEYSFRMDIIISNVENEINPKIIKYLSENVDDEIRETTIDIVRGYIYDHCY